MRGLMQLSVAQQPDFSAETGFESEPLAVWGNSTFGNVCFGSATTAAFWGGVISAVPHN